MEGPISTDLLNIFESLLRAQLHTVKQLRKSAEAPPKELKSKVSMSHMDIVYDILQQQRKPLHVNEIIIMAQKRFNLKLDKESLVSALTKRIKRQDRFIKTGPNIFGLLVPPSEEKKP